MIGESPSLLALTNVIAHAAAPAFLLGAVASFLAILISRLERVVDRKHSAKDRADDPLELRRRASLLNRAIYLAVLSAVTTAALLVLAFALAFSGLQHAYGVGAMFVCALLLLVGSLALFTREVHIATRVAELD